MKFSFDIEKVMLDKGPFKSPPGVMLYREFMIVLTMLEPERTGLIVQALFDVILYGGTDKNLMLTEKECDLLNRMLERYMESVDEYHEICRKNSENGKKSAAARSKRAAQ